MTHTFVDYYGNEVGLSFCREPYSNHPWHVLVICRYDQRWLLTKHPRRGLECPGGKVEKGELPEAAAIREVWEETGARINALHYLGQYEVRGRHDTVVKNVYFAEVAYLQSKKGYMETKGPYLLKDIPGRLDKNEKYSFIMKDKVWLLAKEYVENHYL
ncbi:RNA deprotection pyrophosphohydrolase [Natribacillus halophilus]|uniref:8-oxo-dGTPase n=1 Tax=Natribacillus halophilus TaxID=549003 RepID=A0A1G8NK42_9BACI|nr:nucleoside triphosphatase YtkD [Natribacillus halophilus]SDI80512.1 8-oxo-dGTPase [Natribacillus halophilus]